MQGRNAASRPNSARGTPGPTAFSDDQQQLLAAAAAGEQGGGDEEADEVTSSRAVPPEAAVADLKGCGQLPANFWATTFYLINQASWCDGAGRLPWTLVHP